jgi:hypothetical protein
MRHHDRRSLRTDPFPTRGNSSSAGRRSCSSSSGSWWSCSPSSAIVGRSAVVQPSSADAPPCSSSSASPRSRSSRAPDGYRPLRAGIEPAARPIPREPGLHEPHRGAELPLASAARRAASPDGGHARWAGRSAWPRLPRRRHDGDSQFCTHVSETSTSAVPICATRFGWGASLARAIDGLPSLGTRVPQDETPPARAG